MVLLGLAALFFAGVFLANGVPHYVKGVTGQRHQTPFARSSSAVLNVLWGAANFAAGGALLWLGLAQDAPSIAQAAVFGAGALLVSLSLARLWSKPGA